MLHPIFSTVLGHPELVADHLGNYAALLRLEAAQAARGFLIRAIAGAVAVVGAVLALGFAGVALMLGGLQGTYHWVLVAVPGAMLVIALIAAYVAARPLAFHPFEDVQTQLDADLRALHAAGVRHAD